MKEKGDAYKNDKQNIVTLIDSDMGIAYDESFVNLNCHTNDCMIDSEAPFHVTAHHGLFTSYTNGDYGHVRMEDDGASKIVCVGDILLGNQCWL